MPQPAPSDCSKDCAPRGMLLIGIWILCSLAIAGGVAALVGWKLDIPKLTDLGGDGISMFPNTALCTIFSAAAILLLVGQPQRSLLIVVRSLAAIVLAISGLSLLQHVLGVNFGIDTLLLKRDWGQRAAAAPMRMGMPSATSFLLLSITIIFATGETAFRRIASALALLPIGISFVSIAGFLFGADQLYGLARYTGISSQTSVVIAALGMAAAMLIWDFGIVAALRRRDSGGALLRRLILPIVLLPFILGWLRMVGQGAGLFDVAFGAAVWTLLEVALLFLLIWWTSKSISHLEHQAGDAQARLAAIVESSDDAIVSKSLDGIILSWNSGAERIFGYTSAEVVGKSILLIIPVDRTNEESEILARLRKGERVEHFETVRKRKDGELRHVSLTVSPIRDSTGTIIGASKIARDITQRIQTDLLIRRREAELRTLADTIPQLAWMARPDGFLYWYNKRWYEYTGAKSEDTEGWGWQSLVEQSYVQEVLSRWKWSLETGEPFDMEFPIRGSDGTYRWFLTRVNPLHDEDGKVVRWFGTNTDIEDAKQVERRLREQTRTLELLNETGRVVGSTLETEKLLQAVTDLATELSGAKIGAFFYNVTQDNGESYLLHVLSGAAKGAFEKLGSPRSTPLFSRTFRGEGTFRSDDITQHPLYGQMGPHFGMPQGHPVVRSYLAVPVVSRTGEVIGGLFFGHPEVGVFNEQVEHIIGAVASQAAVAIDNARLYESLKRAADERAALLDAERAARSEAERVSVMKDEFLATLSHELRTPLNAILGWSQLMATGTLSPEDLNQGLEAIERNARVQTQLIEDLLDMSRIISGKVRLDVQSTDLAKVVDQAVESLRPTAEAKQIQLRKIIDPNSGPVTGDPTRLQQIVWNLLSNAIKFTPKEGKVDVLLERVNSHVEITVHDTGIGIKPEFLPQVFERFRQADSSTTRSYGGLGLGLSIVKHLVELHGGTVRAESPGEGFGSTFIVALPLAPVRDRDQRQHPTSSRESTNRLGGISLSGIKILVVDDEMDARELLKRVLTQYQAEVLTATDADVGLKLLLSDSPDVILSDIGMPGKDGYQFLREVRKLPPEKGGKTPAIALTAFARSEDRTRAMLAGYQVHVAKPIEPQELLATVGSLVGRTSEVGA